VKVTLAERLLPLREPLVTSQGTVSRRLIFVVAIEDDAGRIGLGEAAPLPVFGGEDPPTCREALEKGLAELSAEVIEGWLARARPDAALGAGLERLLVKAPCARSAIEGALIDLLAQEAGQPIAETLAGGPALEMVPVNALVGGSLGDLEVAVKEAIAAGYSCFKLKVGGDVFADLRRLKMVRDLIGPNAKLRVDGNGAWDLKQSQTFLEQGRELHLEFVEQLLAAEDLAGLAQLRKAGGALVAADEAIRHPADVARVAAAQAADLIILKPMFLGGWRPTKQAAELARSQGLEVLVTTALDGSIGRAHATHMASALGLGRRAQGLATGALLANDLTDQPLVPQLGSIYLRERPGLAVGSLLAPVPA
jgi:o-succinylbenzoate synthase